MSPLIALPSNFSSVSEAWNEKGQGPGLVGGKASVRLKRSLGSSLSLLISAGRGRCKILRVPLVVLSERLWCCSLPKLAFLKPPGAATTQHFLSGLASLSFGIVGSVCPSFWVLLAHSPSPRVPVSLPVQAMAQGRCLPHHVA